MPPASIRGHPAAGRDRRLRVELQRQRKCASEQVCDAVLRRRGRGRPAGVERRPIRELRRRPRGPRRRRVLGAGAGRRGRPVGQPRSDSSSAPTSTSSRRTSTRWGRVTSLADLEDKFEVVRSEASERTSECGPMSFSANEAARHNPRLRCSRRSTRDERAPGGGRATHPTVRRESPGVDDPGSNPSRPALRGEVRVSGRGENSTAVGARPPRGARIPVLEGCGVQDRRSGRCAAHHRCRDRWL